MPCSLHSIAAAHSKRLTATHWTENLSSLSLPGNTESETKALGEQSRLKRYVFKQTH